MAQVNIGTLSAKITADTSGIQNGLRQTRKGIKDTSKELTKSGKSFKEWSTTSTVATVALSAAVALTARKVLQMADTFTSVQNQIRQTTKSTEELTKRTEQLLGVANRSRVGFAATAELFTQLVLSTENLNLSTSKQIRLTETITKSFAVSGKSAAESAGAIRQLGQAFSAGALRGDEFNSIAEGAPEIMRALQRSLKLTQGELRDLAAEGGITAEILVDALSEAAEVIDKKLAASTKTLSQSLQEAENKAIAFVGSSNAISKAMNTSGELVILLSENLDILTNVALVGAAVGFSRLSAMVIANTIETVKNTQAKFASIPVTAAVNNGINFTSKSLVAQTIVTKKATFATTGLKKAMAFLGGPVGIAILAASALFLFASSADTAEEKAAKLEKTVDKLAGTFNDLNKAELSAKLKENEDEIIRLTNAVLDSERKLAAAKIDPSTISGSIAFAQAQSVTQKLKEELKQAELVRAATLKASEILDQKGDPARAEEAKERAKQKIKDEATKKSFEALQKKLLSERELENASFKKGQETLKERQKLIAISKADQNKAEAQLRKEHQEDLAEIAERANQDEVGIGQQNAGESFEARKLSLANERELAEASFKVSMEKLKENQTLINTSVAEQNKAKEELEMQHKETLAGFDADDLKRKQDLKEEEIERIDKEADEALERLRQKRLNERAFEEEAHQIDLDAEEEKFQAGLITQEERDEIVRKLKFDSQNALTQIEQQAENLRTRNLSSSLDSAASILATGGKKTFLLVKGLAIANAIVQGQAAGIAAFAHGMAAGGPPLAAASLAASNLATTSQIVGIIASSFTSRSSSSGGGGGGSVSAPSQRSPQQSQQQDVSRSIDINFSGEGVLSSANMREFIEQLNEQLGDGAQLNIAGG